jgi:uncharacterized membrane protein YphA (DoxX/SURF4 family)
MPKAHWQVKETCRWFAETHTIFTSIMLKRVLQTDNKRTTILIRLMAGAVYLSEGTQNFLFADKLGTVRFAKIGLPDPAALGPRVDRFEIVCGALILLGLFTKLAAVPLIVIMLVAIATTRAEVLANEGF